MTYNNHQPTGDEHAAAATRILDSVTRHLADPGAVSVAQVHATLAVADALADISELLTELHVIAFDGGTGSVVT